MSFARHERLHWWSRHASRSRWTARSKPSIWFKSIRVCLWPAVHFQGPRLTTPIWSNQPWRFRNKEPLRGLTSKAAPPPRVLWTKRRRPEPMTHWGWSKPPNSIARKNLLAAVITRWQDLTQDHSDQTETLVGRRLTQPHPTINKLVNSKRPVLKAQPKQTNQESGTFGTRNTISLLGRQTTKTDGRRATQDNKIKRDTTRSMVSSHELIKTLGRRASKLNLFGTFPQTNSNRERLPSIDLRQQTFNSRRSEASIIHEDPGQRQAMRPLHPSNTRGHPAKQSDRTERAPLRNTRKADEQYDSANKRDAPIAARTMRHLRHVTSFPFFAA